MTKSNDILSNDDASIIVITGNTQAGTYMLYIEVKFDHKISFGRFQGGRKIVVPSGNYIYIGSALAERGATSLGNRLQRHTLRTDQSNPHEIHLEVRQLFSELDIHYTNNPSNKTLFWNVDHLLDLSDAEIKGIIAIQSSTSLENTWSEFVEQREDTTIFAKGLGANDSAGHTHLVGTSMTFTTWINLADRLPKEQKSLR